MVSGMIEEIRPELTPAGYPAIQKTANLKRPEIVGKYKSGQLSTHLFPMDNIIPEMIPDVYS
jgi:hypothetical protein